MAHLGVIEALVDGGEEFDLVGGTSMGALVSVLLAQLPPGVQPRDLTARFTHIESVMLTMKFGRRLTLPAISLLSIRRATAIYETLLGTADLLDSWRPVFVTTADLTTCELKVIDRGPAHVWARASATPPGMWPPVADAQGHLHVDGALYDNLPVMPMRRKGASRVIAVRVNNRSSFAIDPGGPQVESWRTLLRQRLRSGPSASFPLISKTLGRTVVATSLAAQNEAIANADAVIEPAVDDIGLADYRRFRHAVTEGRTAGRSWIESARR